MNKYIYMRFPQNKTKAFTLSYDDCVEQDIEFTEMCDKYGLKATFNLNSGCYVPEGTVFEKGRVHRRVTYAKAQELYNKNGHEVATHSYTHPFLEKLSPVNVCYEIIKDREVLEEQFGCVIRGHAYPYGTYSDSVVECLRSCGIVYARTTRATHSFDIPEDWLRLHPTCHHDDGMVEELMDKFIGSAPDRAPWLFYMWGHTFELEQKNNWDHMEHICQKISNKEDVWYANNIDIYNYVKAYEALVFSADMRYVQNPSAIAVCLVCNGKNYTVPAGETICLG